MKKQQKDPRAIGDLKGFPTEIIDAMLDEQERQGNKRDVRVFQNIRCSDKTHRGFNWYTTSEETMFWDYVIFLKNFDLFFERYPKQLNNTTMQVKFKKLNPNAITPKYATEQSAGLDIVPIGYNSPSLIIGGAEIVLHTGLAFEIPQGYVGHLYARSSMYQKTLARLSNSVGVIDSDYRGEVLAKVITNSPETMARIEDAILGKTPLFQLVIVPVLQAELVEAEELRDTERGEGGYGSTDKINS